MHSFFRIASAMIELEWRRVMHDRTEVYIRALQSAIWLVLFGFVLSNLKAIPTGGIPYLDYLVPGILIQSTTASAIVYSLMIIWERESGILKKLVSSPAPRYAIAIGRSLSAGMRALFQTALLLPFAAFLGVRFLLNPLYIFIALFAVFISASGFAALSMALASVFKTREKFMGIGQLVIFPLFFASSALYPLSSMPDAIRIFATINPLTYVIDATRSLLITGNVQNLPADLAVVVAFAFCMFALATIRFKTIVE